MPRAGLTRAGVVSAAVEAVDGVGFDGLTLAALAASAGVAVPSLYKHVSSLADLRREVAIVSMNQLTATMTESVAGRSDAEALQAMAGAIRDFARRHPGRYSAAQVAPNLADPADAELADAAGRAVDVPTAVLRGFELPSTVTIDAIRIVRSAVHGFISLELGGGFGLPDDLDRSFDLLVDTVVAGIRTLADGPAASDQPVDG